MISFAVACVLVLSTMRARNGFRGPHELASGTRVIRLRFRENRQRAAAKPVEPAPQLLQVEGMPERVGSFTVLGVLQPGDGGRVLLAEDSSLGRRVWLLVHARGAGGASERRRFVSRPTRPRWLAKESDGERRWDAYVAPAGTPERSRRS